MMSDICAGAPRPPGTEQERRPVSRVELALWQGGKIEDKRAVEGSLQSRVVVPGGLTRGASFATYPSAEELTRTRRISGYTFDDPSTEHHWCFAHARVFISNRRSKRNANPFGARERKTQYPTAH